MCLPKFSPKLFNGSVEQAQAEMMHCTQTLSQNIMQG